MRRVYHGIIIVLCILSVFLAFTDLNGGLSPRLYALDIAIYCVFVADYVIRLFLAEDKKRFFKENVLDLIAIIPFTSAFQVFRSLRILKAVKLLKLVRLGSFAARGFKNVRRFLDRHGLKYIFYISLGAILISALLMMYFENMSFGDAIWWAFVTTTTVGYGDLSPTTGVGRLIAVLLMITGIGLIGALTSNLTTLFLEKPEEQEVSSERVEMVMALYEKLNDQEKAAFLQAVSEENGLDKKNVEVLNIENE